MELDEVQNWVDIVKRHCQGLLEEEELYLHLLGEIKKPWLLSQTPQTTQETYRNKLEQEKQDADCRTKESRLYNELGNIDNILRKARLLHDKTDEVKEKSKGDSINEKTTVDKAGRLPQSTAKAKQKSGVSKMQHGKLVAKRGQRTDRHSKSAKMKQGDSLSKAGVCMVNSQKKCNSVNNGSLLTREKRNPIHDVIHQRSDQPPNPTPCEQDINVQNDKPSAISIDLSKVKLQYSEFKSQLSLPPKMKKLLSNHAKLHDQTSDAWTDSICNEEITFCRNLCKKSGHGPNYSQFYTRQSILQDAHKYIVICINVINILKFPSMETSPSKVSSKSPDYKLCYASLSLDIMEKILEFLKVKSVELSRGEAIDFCDSIDDDETSGWTQLFKDLQHVDGMDHDLLLPVTTILHNTPASVRRLFIEKLMHQCLVLECELSRKIAESYFALINRLFKNQKGSSVPSSELAHVLQNAYGILDENGMLLPAFVLEK